MEDYRKLKFERDLFGTEKEKMMQFLSERGLWAEFKQWALNAEDKSMWEYLYRTYPEFKDQIPVSLKRDKVE